MPSSHTVRITFFLDLFEVRDSRLNSPSLSFPSPPQIGGIRFLYDNLVESVERFGSSSGFGCILAHSMGLGKTLQVISFIDVLFRHTQAHTVLAIVPVSTCRLEYKEM